MEGDDDDSDCYCDDDAVTHWGVYGYSVVWEGTSVVTGRIGDVRSQ